MMFHVTDVLPYPGKVSPEALERGRRIHEATAKIDLESVIDGPEEDSAYLDGYLKWHEELDPRIVEVEMEVSGAGYIGTCDRLCRIRTGPSLVEYVLEIKTGSVPKSAPLQLAAYAAALQVKGIYPRRAVLLLTGNRDYKLFLEGRDSMFTPSDYAVFCAYLTAKRWEYNNGLWKPKKRR